MSFYHTCMAPTCVSRRPNLAMSIRSDELSSVQFNSVQLSWPVGTVNENWQRVHTRNVARINHRGRPKRLLPICRRCRIDSAFPTASNGWSWPRQLVPLLCPPLSLSSATTDYWRWRQVFKQQANIHRRQSIFSFCINCVALISRVSCALTASSV